MGAQLEKEPETRKIEKFEKKSDSESALRNINDTQQNDTNFSKVEKGQKVTYDSLIH